MQLFKKYFFFLLIINSANVFSQAGWWTWMTGAVTNNGAATYGTIGVPAANNTPPGLYQSAACWTDSQGMLWVFGGGAGNFSSTLWKYNPTINMWTWVNGPNTLGNGGVWGTKGVPSINNIPSSRGMGVATWVDAQDNLWLFGGEGDGSASATQGWLADLWKYDPVTNMWTWMNGPSTINQPGVYGTQGVPAVANYPTPRSETNATWVDNNGKFWLFGGETPSGMKNDLWKYDPVTNQWTWMKGSSGVNNAGSYGTQGVTVAGNNPPARWAYCRWKDNNGNFWMFGGNGGINLTMNDMWKFDPTTNSWTWMSGSNLKNQLPALPSKCVPSTTNYPQARYENSVAWKDKCGNFWMFGGHWAASLSVPDINDVWCYKVQTNEWVFVGGNIAPVSGTQGVAAATNMPRARYSSAAWSNNNVFWMFGGRSSILQEFNTLWRYIPDTTCAQSTCTLPPQNPTANFSGINLTGCASLTVTFTNTSTNSNSWTWNFGDGSPTSGVQNPTHTYPNPGQYTVTLIASNGTTNDTTSFVNYVTVVPNAVASANYQDTICAGQSVNFNNTSTGATSYLWSNSNLGINDTSTNLNYTFNNAGTYTISLYAINQFGCNDTSLLTVTVLNNFNVTNNIALCNGSTYTLPNGQIVSAAGTYIDTLGTGPCDSIVTTIIAIVSNFTFTQNPVLCVGSSFTLPDGTTASIPGTYIDTIQSVSGCDSIVTTVLTFNQNSSSAINPIICSNQNYILPSGIVVNTSGVYVDTVLASNGCDSIITTTVVVNSTPAANVTADITINIGDSTSLTASGGSIYNWYPSTGLNNVNTNQVIATPIVTTTYCVEITASNGCKDTACVTVTVELGCDNEATLGVPNAFSPNNDNVNNEFCLQGWDDCIEKFKVIIFDRWGEKVYESIDPNFCWDGKHKGNQMDAQVFVYYIEAKFLEKENMFIRKGNISLIR